MKKSFKILITNHQVLSKKSIAIIYSLFVIFVLESCDPAKVLQVRTINNPNYSITIYANRNILPYADGDRDQKFILQIPTNDIKPKTDTAFSYGIGPWPNKNGMEQFSKNIDSIIIIRNGVKQSLSDQNDITDYLVKQRRGLGKSILRIEAK